MKNEFSFPDFYGANIHALIDCLSSMRYPDDEMSEVTLQNDEILLIEAIGLSQSNIEIVGNFLAAIEQTNNREIERNQLPSIFLSCK